MTEDAEEEVYRQRHRAMLEETSETTPLGEDVPNGNNP